MSIQFELRLPLRLLLPVLWERLKLHSSRTQILFSTSLLLFIYSTLLTVLVNCSKVRLLSKKLSQPKIVHVFSTSKCFKFNPLTTLATVSHTEVIHQKICTSKKTSVCMIYFWNENLILTLAFFLCLFGSQSFAGSLLGYSSRLLKSCHTSQLLA